MKPGESFGLPYWLEQYHEMMTGRGHLRPEKPLLQLYMETRWRGACDDSYLEDVEALWKLTQTTQIRGHLAILNAEQILGADVPVANIDARALMEKRMVIQKIQSGEITCPTFALKTPEILRDVRKAILGLVTFLLMLQLN